jgi:hypothetical protein
VFTYFLNWSGRLPPLPTPVKKPFPDEKPVAAAPAPPPHSLHDPT